MLGMIHLPAGSKYLYTVIVFFVCKDTFPENYVSKYVLVGVHNIFEKIGWFSNI